MTSVGEILEAGARFINGNPNIVRRIYKSSLYNDEPQLYQFTVHFKDRHANRILDDSIATGIAFDKRKALLKLFGEIIERYSLTAYDTKTFIFASFNELDKRGLNPKEVIAFSNTQLQSLDSTLKYTPSSKFHWIRGQSLLRKGEILIPAQLVFVPYEYEASEPILRLLTSTGAAAGVSLEDALYRGICEVVERDSFMIAYLNKLSSSLIDISDSKNVYIRGILESLERYELEFAVVDLTTDVKVFSVAAIILDKTGKGPAISVGLRAGFDIEDVIINAIEEALMARSWLRDRFSFNPKAKISRKTIATIEDRALFWFPVKKISLLDFWIKSKEKRMLGDYPCVTESKRAHLNKIQNIFQKREKDILYIDITAPEAREAGFIVVKVVIPYLQPLYLDEKYKYLGTERLYEAPVKMRVLEKSLQENELNRIPHPFL